MDNEGYITVVIGDETTSGEPCYVASHPELPGCMATGFTEDEAIENLADALILYVGALKRRGLSVPPAAGGWQETLGTARVATTAEMALPSAQWTASNESILATASS
jgi:predicted RNase H-like HicB family nuclease